MAVSRRFLRAALSSLSVALLANTTPAVGAEINWQGVQEETLRHFQTMVRMDTSDPPGGEMPVVEYLKSVLEKEGIEVKTFALNPDRPNLVARLKGSGKKKPILIMGHTDVVNVDPAKWTFPPFSAARDGGYIYGRGTVDDKDNVTACLMTMLLLKRQNVALDRDVIFLAESGEEGSVRFGIAYMVKAHWPEIEAEYCLAEGGGVARTGGVVRYASIQTTEKIPYAIKLIAHGVAGHGSVPLRSNAVVHMAMAIAKIGAWQMPMRLNETTRAFFERLAQISSPEEAARYRTILRGDETGAVQEYFADKEPRFNSTIRTSVSPNMIIGGYRVNVIPSQVESTLDVRMLPDENVPAFIETLRKVIDDPLVEVAFSDRDTRPGAVPTSLGTEVFQALERGNQKYYKAVTLPTMSTGATDMAYLRAKGVQCYGVGPMTDTEDGPKGFGAHSDQERILEEALHTFVQFNFDVVSEIAAVK